MLKRLGGAINLWKLALFRMATLLILRFWAEQMHKYGGVSDVENVYPSIAHPLHPDKVSCSSSVISYELLILRYWDLFHHCIFLRCLYSTSDLAAHCRKVFYVNFIFCTNCVMRVEKFKLIFPCFSKQHLHKFT